MNKQIQGGVGVDRSAPSHLREVEGAGARGSGRSGGGDGGTGLNVADDSVKEIVEVEGVTGTDGVARFDDREVTEFDDMGLSYPVVHGIYSFGFEKPSQIQMKGILPLVSSNPPVDIIAQAQSGTGKTGTFVVAMLQNLDDEVEKLQGLVLAPTHELAVQIYKVFVGIGQFTKFRVHCCVGGTRVGVDIAKLQEGCHVVVGTPGRVKHMVEEGHLPTADIRMLMIDEADQMLSFGFKEQLYEMFRFLPPNMQIGLFSATMPADVVELAERFLRDPLKILLKRERITLEGIKQFFVYLNEEQKYATLCDLYKRLTISKAMIFCNSRRRVDELADRMNADDYTVSKMHSGLLSERRAVMKAFQSGSARVLISTDLLGRGIDVHQVSLVINYDMPRKDEPYIHRVGRCGRYGRTGVSINFVTPRDWQRQQEIEYFYQTQIEPLPKDVNKYLT